MTEKLTITLEITVPDGFSKEYGNPLREEIGEEAKKVVRQKLSEFFMGNVKSTLSIETDKS